MKSIASLLSASTLASLVMSPLVQMPAVANLGAAEIGQEATSFDAFCAKRGKKCTVVFTEHKMSVDGAEGIERGQLIRIWEDRELRGFWDRTPGDYYHPVYYVTYRRLDGSDSTAKFLFINAEAGNRFWAALNVFMGPERRPVGPSIKVID